MTFSTEEKRLLVLYYSGSAGDTAAVVREALIDIRESEERAAAMSLLYKLEKMNMAALDSFVAESEAIYD